MAVTGYVAQDNLATSLHDVLLVNQNHACVLIPEPLVEQWTIITCHLGEKRSTKSTKFVA